MFDEFRKHVAASGRSDILLHRTGCTGRCSREPIVGVFVPGQMPVKYERVDRNLVHEIFTSHVLGGKPVLKTRARRADRADRQARNSHLRQRALRLEGRAAFEDGDPRETGRCRLPGRTRRRDGRQLLRRLQHRPTTGTARTCSSGRTRCSIASTNEADLDEIIRAAHPGRRDRSIAWRCHGKTIGRKFFELYGDVAFFNRQSRVALRHNGVIDPESMEEYFHYRGFQALVKVLEKGDPQWVIDEVTARSSAAAAAADFATGQKWAMAAKAHEKTRYIICNADEGDPGAFMDRSMLESDPLNVIEGMMIGGYAIGAQQGFFYVRAEYPMAIHRIQHAIEQCRDWGLLGKNILGSGFDFDLEIRLGAGAFVCGEETALIHSIEGERGQPRDPPAVSPPRAACGASRR